MCTCARTNPNLDTAHHGTNITNGARTVYTSLHLGLESPNDDLGDSQKPLPALADEPRILADVNANGLTHD